MADLPESIMREARRVAGVSGYREQVEAISRALRERDERTLARADAWLLQQYGIAPLVRDADRFLSDDEGGA